jgi:T5SS/PEP-CTERM-associated repeat protein
MTATFNVAASSAAGTTGAITVESAGTWNSGNVQIALAGGAGTGTVTVTGAGSSITQTGASTTTVGNPSSGPGTLNVNNGAIYNSGTGLTLVHATGTLNILGGTFNLNGNLEVRLLGTLTIGGSANSWSGELDIHARKMVVDVSGPAKASRMATLINQVNYGLTHDAGITSSALPANTAIAVMDNGVLGKSTFGGITVGINSILVGPELLGDANVDGVVNFNDFVIVSQNFGSTGGWVQGNFGTDAVVDFNDFVTFSQHFGQSWGGATNLELTEEQMSAMQAFSMSIGAPEPGTLGLLGMAALMLARRRRK